jgi:ABC-2 type transport system ATP-binding protein
VGHLVAGSAAYPELSVREHLEIARRLQGIADPAATGAAIERFGLGAAADRAAGVLSTGNRQRLGLARATLHHPELLILDEPVNGLDPAGVVEVRALLQELAARDGVTVFMSSHILSEVDRCATRFGIIHRGRLIDELTAAELDRRRQGRLLVGARDLEAAERVLVAGGFAPVTTTAGGLLALASEHARAQPDEVAIALVRGEAPPTFLAVEREDLESYFLRLTAAAE